MWSVIKMNNKVGIATVFTGFNYGSALQAYAVKSIISDAGYEAELLKLGGSIVAGRDVRLGKLLALGVRSLFSSGGLKAIKNYKKSMSKRISINAEEMFKTFTAKELRPTVVSYGGLKRISKDDEYIAFVCGSDQVWNSASYYVDPFYYLRFAPKEKRIAFAPSFGRDFIPEYNQVKIKRYVSDIPDKSTRESSGAKIIEELTGEKVEALVDPTLVLSSREWEERLGLRSNNEKYLLAYFLDKPNEKSIKIITELSEKYNLKVLRLPYEIECGDWKSMDAGPKEFVNL